MTDYSDLLFRLDFGDDAIIALQIRIRKLEAALKPFAYYAQQIPDDVSDTASASGTVGDLRQARKVLGAVSYTHLTLPTIYSV